MSDTVAAIEVEDADTPPAAVPRTCEMTADAGADADADVDAGAGAGTCGADTVEIPIFVEILGAEDEEFCFSERPATSATLERRGAVPGKVLDGAEAEAEAGVAALASIAAPGRDTAGDTVVDVAGTDFATGAALELPADGMAGAEYPSTTAEIFLPDVSEIGTEGLFDGTALETSNPAEADKASAVEPPSFLGTATL